MDEENQQLWDDQMIIDAYDRTMADVNQRVENLMKIDTKAVLKQAKKRDDTANDTANDTPNDTVSQSSSILPQSSTSQVQPAESKAIVEQSTTKRSQTKQRSGAVLKWNEGDHCQAVYEEDGLPYEAIIVAIENDGSCRVRYVGYENEEIKSLDELRPSGGQEVRKEQEGRALEEKLYALNDSISESEDTDELASNKAQASNRSYPPMAPVNAQCPVFSPPQMSASNSRQGVKASSAFLIPPPPTSLPPMASIDENELLTTTLMSWYMSGYHTGYFQAIRDLKRSN